MPYRNPQTTCQVGLTGLTHSVNLSSLTAQLTTPSRHNHYNHQGVLETQGTFVFCSSFFTSFFCISLMFHPFLGYIWYLRRTTGHERERRAVDKAISTDSPAPSPFFDDAGHLQQERVSYDSFLSFSPSFDPAGLHQHERVRNDVFVPFLPFLRPRQPPPAGTSHF